MFVREDGTYECSLSGGCLEPAVAEAAAQVIATGEPAVVGYDLAEDSVWGLGIGCSGAVDIRIERLEDDAITGEWLTILDRGDAAVLVTPLSGVSGRLIVGSAGTIAGQLSDAIVEQKAITRARDAAARTVARVRCRVDRQRRALLRNRASPARAVISVPDRTQPRRADGLDARLCRDGCGRPGRVPDAEPVSGRDAESARISASSPNE